MANFVNKSQNSFRIVSSNVFKNIERASLNSETLSIVGTSVKGPAFVPTQVRSYNLDQTNTGIINTWENLFGEYESQEKTPGVVTSKLWFENGGQQLSFTRILGIGNLEDEEVSVNNYLGFTVGNKVISGSIEENKLNNNSYSIEGGLPGRTYFLGEVVSNKNIENEIVSTGDYFEQLGFENTVENLGFVNKIVLASSGTQITYQDINNDNLDVVRLDLLSKTNNLIESGSSVSSVSNPKLFLKGLDNKNYNILSQKEYSNIKDEYNENFLNRIEDCYLEKGNLLYIDAGRNNLYTKNKTSYSSNKNFILSGSYEWNTSDDNNQNHVNYEDFIDEFKTAKTPWVYSQPVNRDEILDNRANLKSKCKKLFRIHALSDGVSGNNIRIRITPLRILEDNFSFKKYSKFSIEVFEYNKNENEYFSVLQFEDVDLDPDSENYICKLIGTQREFFNKKTRRVEIKGFYRQTNNYIRVEVDDNVEDKKTESNLIPSGFDAYPIVNIGKGKTTCINNKNDNENFVEDFVFKPVEYVSNTLLTKNDIRSKIENPYWGVLFDSSEMIKIKDYKHEGFKYNLNFLKKIENNKNYINNIHYYSKYLKEKFYLNQEETDVMNGFFHLEKILYFPEEDKVFDRWEVSLYRRDGKKPTEINSLYEFKNYYKYVNLEELLLSRNNNNSDDARFLSFDFYTFGGFDGVDILDRDKKRINGVSLSRELEDQYKDQELFKGSTFRSLNIAREISSEYSNCVTNIYSIPSYNHYKFIKKTVELANEKRSFHAIIDIPEYDENGNIVIGNIYELDYKNPDKYFINKFNKNLKNKIQKGTNKTINKFLLNNIISEYSSAYMNRCVGFSTGLYDEYEIYPSTNYISQLAKTSLGTSVDSSDPITNTILNINSIFSEKTEEIDDYLDTVKKSNINMFFKSYTKGIVLSSDNMLMEARYNLKRYSFNRRVLLKIKNDIRELIFRGYKGYDPVLFNNNHERGFVYENFQIMLNLLFTEYLESNIIKNYKINIQSNFSLNTNYDKLNNLIQGSIEIELLGNSRYIIEKINLYELLSNFNSLENDINNILNKTLP